MKAGVGTKLNPTKRSNDARDFEAAMRRKIVGQDAAVEKVAEIYQMFLAGLNAPGRPVGNLLFLGPTGSGKTRCVESMAESLFGDARACIKIDCAEFQHSHEIAKLIGCFIPGTRVLMADGTSKPIEEVKVGDWVIGENGVAHRVIKVHRYDYSGPMVRILTANSNIPVVCTPPHEVWAIRASRTSKRATTIVGRDVKSQYLPEELEYIASEELQKGDIVVYPRQKFVWASEPMAMAASAGAGTVGGTTSTAMAGIVGKVIDLAGYRNEFVHNSFSKHRFNFDDTHVWLQPSHKIPRFIDVNEDFCRLAGYYVSEGGNSKNRKSINFTFGSPFREGPLVQEVQELLTKMFGKINIRVRIRDGKTRNGVKTKNSSVRMYYSNSIVSHLMADLFGDFVLRKHLPEWFFRLEPRLLWNFLDTAFLGDGGKTVRRRLDYSTSSPDLASQMRLLIHNLGFTTQMQRRERKKDKRGYKVSPRYRLYVAGDQFMRFVDNLPAIRRSANVFNPGNAGIQRMSHVDDDYIYNRIKSVGTVCYEGPVYDLSIDDEPSYVVDFKVHNSPPGYLGHRETHPLLTQEALNQWHTEKLKLSILLFDEIEKASDSLWQLLLGILDKATLTLGDNRRVDLSSCIIVMTSNLGAADMNELMNGGMGFANKGDECVVNEKLDDKIQRTAVEAARRKFSPEFMNRIDKSVVFKTLRPEHLTQILEIELGMVQQRVLMAAGANQFVFNCTPAVKALLLKEGTDPKYGARHLKRAIERNLVFPLANLVATGQVKLGDFVRIDIEDDELTFTKEAEGAMVPVLMERYGAAAGGDLRKPVNVRPIVQRTPTKDLPGGGGTKGFGA